MRLLAFLILTISLLTACPPPGQEAAPEMGSPRKPASASRAKPGPEGAPADPSVNRTYLEFVFDGEAGYKESDYPRPEWIAAAKQAVEDAGLCAQAERDKLEADPERLEQIDPLCYDENGRIRPFYRDGYCEDFDGDGKQEGIIILNMPDYLNQYNYIGYHRQVFILVSSGGQPQIFDNYYGQSLYIIRYPGFCHFGIHYTEGAAASNEFAIFSVCDGQVRLELADNLPPSSNSHPVSDEGAEETWYGNVLMEFHQAQMDILRFSLWDTEADGYSSPEPEKLSPEAFLELFRPEDLRWGEGTSWEEGKARNPEWAKNWEETYGGPYYEAEAIEPVLVYGNAFFQVIQKGGSFANGVLYMRDPDGVWSIKGIGGSGGSVRPGNGWHSHLEEKEPWSSAKIDLYQAAREAVPVTS